MARVLTQAKAEQLGLAGRKSLEIVSRFPVAGISKRTQESTPKNMYPRVY